MTKIYLTLISLISFTCLYGQAYDEVSTGPGYGNATYYNIQDGEQTSIAHSDWDIAFAVGAQSTGVFINEAVPLAMGPPPPSPELYVTSATEFATVDTTGMERILNDEASWEAGAFNHVAVAADPFDLGWGAYNPSNHQVTSTRIFVLKTRAGAFKKLEIQSLIGGVYAFRYADLDGSNEVSRTITKSEFTGKTLAYYSFETEEVLDLEPEHWDLMFTRYSTVLGGGEPYMVTGMLSNANVSIAEASGVNPVTVSHLDYAEEYSTNLTVVGHDWKSFSLADFSWSVPSDLVYFVNTAQGELYKIQFIDFSGSSSGTATLAKTFINGVSSVENTPLAALGAFSISPNPATSFVRASFSFSERVDEVNVFITNALGQVVEAQQVDAVQGDNSIDMPLNNLQAGTYFVRLQAGNGVQTLPLIVH